MAEEDELSAVRKRKDGNLKTAAGFWGETRLLLKRFGEVFTHWPPADAGVGSATPRAEEARAEGDPRQVRTGAQP